MLVYDAKVLLIYFTSIGIALVIIVAHAFVNPAYAIASVVLFLPAGFLIKAAFSKWNAKEQPGF